MSQIEIAEQQYAAAAEEHDAAGPPRCSKPLGHDHVLRKQSEVARLAGVDRYTISRAVKSGILKTHGRRAVYDAPKLNDEAGNAIPLAKLESSRLQLILPEEQATTDTFVVVNDTQLLHRTPY